MQRAILIHVEINDGQNQKLQSDFNKLWGPGTHLPSLSHVCVFLAQQHMV
jgi:hypothetical protein